MHTSTVTVAVMDPAEASAVEFNDRDFRVEWYSGTGCGGQHRNKHQNSCRITHIPTGVVATAQTRSRQSSLEQAQTEILSRVNGATRSAAEQAGASDRRAQVGTGMRGDKVRTYRFQDNTVKDHRTGRQAAADAVMGGGIPRLW